MRLVETYMETGSIAETARRWPTSRNVVPKWVERYRDEAVKRLRDRSRRPHRSPSRTQAQTEDVVVEAKKATGYGRKRLAWYLGREKGLVPSPHTIRAIGRRKGYTGRKTKRKRFYPAPRGLPESLHGLDVGMKAKANLASRGGQKGRLEGKKDARRPCFGRSLMVSDRLFILSRIAETGEAPNLELGAEMAISLALAGSTAQQILFVLGLRGWLCGLDFIQRLLGGHSHGRGGELPAQLGRATTGDGRF